MKLKGKLIEFMIVHDLVPVRIRWGKSASRIGRMFNDVFHMLDKNERIKLTKMMHSWGLEDAGEVVETLKIERNLHGCAIALMGMHRVFGTKSRIDKNILHICTKRRSDGDNFCELVLRNRDYFISKS
ncbi:MAG: hypothetical protein MPEBLZ_02449 [Candidatus Methanoperedens nitroreducens]|uniref:Uncharacterized protein n=1 Tax=Candidatus Methanoperedens nitratireducens TaxID=1392998 RepID=A0A0P8CJB1_9EURY|nr:hypothetical protein [Candidatus Methanoperedens sp. BLZ2]KAB2943032.1 MAG: hypothetical protein F9K14_16380 [Candidatus Methanoperedens sp.]KPQ42990.1 MAG: hypothetical protein MPEBLZ_02449 [Candidatus Methanoperedens sp. BLZ1]MBZ0176511.1 hypothetical protein [Candidatus Methanoperedens nitroreducens]MCX9078327.1 hypothetical protein [Candidatus Methanoperedens sp.]